MTPDKITSYGKPSPYGSTIDIITYNLYSADWWKGQTALLTKTQENISGDVIKKGWQVTIIQVMQEKRFNYYIHHGGFAIRDPFGIEIWGVDCYDLILLE